MSVMQVRELICDCREPDCRSVADEAESCGYAITDYAETHAQIRARGAGTGWSVVNLGAWNQRDYCPKCTTHRGSDLGE